MRSPLLVEMPGSRPYATGRRPRAVVGRVRCRTPSERSAALGRRLRRPHHSQVPTTSSRTVANACAVGVAPRPELTEVDRLARQDRLYHVVQPTRAQDEIKEQAAEDPAFVDDPASVKPASGLPSTLRGGPDESIVSRVTRGSIGYDLAVRPRRSAGVDSARSPIARMSLGVGCAELRGGLAMTTGLVFHERYLWHDTGHGWIVP